jgi:tRNA-dihydrouridine synthase
MVGRGIFGNPWFFNPEIIRDRDISLEERLRVLIEHTKLFCELLPHKNFSVMKKHYKAYVEGFDGAKELRVKLMDAKDVQEIEQIIEDFLRG